MHTAGNHTKSNTSGHAREDGWAVGQPAQAKASESRPPRAAGGGGVSRVSCSASSVRSVRLTDLPSRSPLPLAAWRSSRTRERVARRRLADRSPTRGRKPEHHQQRRRVHSATEGHEAHASDDAAEAIEPAKSTRASAACCCGPLLCFEEKTKNRRDAGQPPGERRRRSRTPLRRKSRALEGA